ncbi:MAG: AgmX/PglI C-terminal domain-containing protein [Deltaproteobacteria bacterium]|nr:AgmX/PglI C-terminal domain-containing protein [Deltaproteobacteria bacterium]
MRKRLGLAVRGLGLGSFLVFGLAGGCNKPDEGLTARLMEANSKNVACQKELAEAKATRDNLKKQLAIAIANPTRLQLTDPEMIELIADARKARGAGPEFGQGDLNPKEASAIVMRGAPALQGCYERALKRNAGLQMRTGLGVTLGITVKPAGAVDSVDVTPSVDAEMTKCIKATIIRWKFPTFTGHAVTIEQKLTLTPKT